MRWITTLALSMGIFAAALLVSTTAWAECQGNQVPVTVINPNGKVIQICVTQRALDGIREGGASSGGAQLIPAICPCFTQEEVQNLMPTVCQSTQYPTFPIIEGETCNYVRCDTDSSLILAMEAPAGVTGCTTTQEFPGPDNIQPNGCWIYPTGPGPLHISEDEADACVAILRTFLP